MKTKLLFVLGVGSVLTACQKEEITPTGSPSQAVQQLPLEDTSTEAVRPAKPQLETREVVEGRYFLPRPIPEKPIIIIPFPGPIRTLPVEPITLK